MRNRAGFTLVELLVALVISGLLAGVIFQMLMGQSRFVGIQSAREEVQQNARGALELIAGELRNVPAGGVQAADGYSLTIRVPRTWGIVCAPAVGNVVDVAFPGGLGLALDGSANRPWPRLVAKLSPTPTWSAPQTVTSVAPASSLAGSTTCGGSALAAGAEMRSFTVPSTAGMAAGQSVYLYDPVSYRNATLSDPAGLWLQRLVGTDPADYRVLAGPIAPGYPVRFKYYRADGTPIPIPSGGLTAATGLGSVARVEVVVNMRSTRGSQQAPQSSIDSTAVFLRNGV